MLFIQNILFAKIVFFNVIKKTFLNIKNKTVFSYKKKTSNNNISHTVFIVRLYLCAIQLCCHLISFICVFPQYTGDWHK